jgi:hypothetical protein
MADVTALRKALATRLDLIPGMRVAAHAADRVSVPMAVVEIASISFDAALGRGADLLVFTVRVYASRADDRAGQEQLDGFLAGSGPKSVKAAIESDSSLGGIAHDLVVAGVDNYGIHEAGGISYYGAEFAVQVWASG